MSLIRQISRRTVVLQNTEAEVATSKTVTPYYEWVFNGQLNIPVETSLDTLHHTDSENTLYQVRVTARQAGDSTYRIKLVSYNLTGANEITHVDSTVVFTNDKQTYLLPIADAPLPTDRVIEARIFEEIVGATPAVDVTVSATLGSLTEVQPLSVEYLIQREDDTVLPKRSKLKFDNLLYPITDNLPDDRTEIGFDLDLLKDLLKEQLEQVGDVKQSLLTEVQFQDLHGTDWVLADGRSVVGSEYETITGQSSIPDIRGTYLRGKDNGRGLDPNGDPALGSFQGDAFASHKHSSNWRYHNGGSALAGVQMAELDTHMPGSVTSISTISGSSSNTINNTGGNETRPKSTIVNVFIKIN